MADQAYDADATRHAVATRYDKHPENYLASVKLAPVRIWMRYNESVASASPANI